MRFFVVLILIISYSSFVFSVHATPVQTALEKMLSEDPDFAVEMQTDFQEFNNEKESELIAFRDERDADFSEFLREKWEDFNEFSGLVRDPEPKPVVIPKAFEKPKDTPPPPGKTAKPIVLDPPPTLPVVKIPTPVKPVPDVPVVQPVKKPKVPVPPEPEPVVKKDPLSPSRPVGQRIEINFYGQPLVFYYDAALTGGQTTLDNNGISDFWSRVSTTDYQALLDQLLNVRQNLELNDWGYYQLLQKSSLAVTGDQNDSVLLSWFLLNKSGFESKMGYSNEHAFLLVPSRNTVFEVPYYDIDGVRFYNFTFIETGLKPGQIRTYRSRYPGADNKVAFGLLTSPQLPSAIKKRNLNFSYNSKNHKIPVTMNLNAIEFYRAYPSTDMQIFFAARVDTVSAKSLIEGLRPIIAGKKEAEAANILLRFVQTAFEYKTDDAQFGGEKYMFAAETLFYPYSDCEDRSILFSYLVHELLQLEVVGLIYPGHASTAVRFSQSMSGDQIEINGARYLICDPTYINADIGMAMPQFKQSKPTVIPIY